MIGILTRNFVHVEDEALAIDVAYFILSQYYGRSGNYHRPIGETIRGATGGAAGGRWIGCGEMLYQAGVILVHDSHLFSHTMYLTVKSL